MAELTVIDCRTCGRRTAPPAYVCSNCGSDDLVKVDIPGEGEIYSHTTIYVPPSGFEGLVPYTVGVVKVAGGLLIAGRLMVANDNVPPIGSLVKLIEGTAGRYVFAPTETA